MPKIASHDLVADSCAPPPPAARRLVHDDTNMPVVLGLLLALEPPATVPGGSSERQQISRRARAFQHSRVGTTSCRHEPRPRSTTRRAEERVTRGRATNILVYFILIPEVIPTQISPPYTYIPSTLSAFCTVRALDKLYRAHVQPAAPLGVCPLVKQSAWLPSADRHQRHASPLASSQALCSWKALH